MTPSGLMPRRTLASAACLTAAAVIGIVAVAGCGSSNSKSNTTHTSSSSADPVVGSAGGFTTRAFASGVGITINTPSGKTSIYQPDDITNLGSDIYVGFQNNVGTKGEPALKGSAGTGGLDSTVVEFSSSGSPVAHWQIPGHVDGVTADPSMGNVIATTNEDGNAHLFVIAPGSSQAVSYTVPTLPHGGGLDAISVWHGMTLISASAPANTGKGPAVYVVSLNPGSHAISVRSLFTNNATVTGANPGASGTSKLALSDPDSNAVVPTYAQRFGGQFELNSQGDLEQIFAADPSAAQLSMLKQSVAIDDSVWASGPSGTLYAVDSSADLIYKITGPFQRGAEYVSAAPCNANSAPTACPAPGYKSNYIGEIDQSTGAVTKVNVGAPIEPKGMLFVP